MKSQSGKSQMEMLGGTGAGRDCEQFLNYFFLKWVRKQSVYLFIKLCFSAFQFFKCLCQKRDQKGVCFRYSLSEAVDWGEIISLILCHCVLGTPTCISHLTLTTNHWLVSLTPILVMNKLGYQWIILTQWFSNLASQWKHLESLINGLRFGPTPTHSDLISLEYSLGIRGFKSSPGDFFKVQQSLRTTNNLLKVTDLRWQKSWFCWAQGQLLPIWNYFCLNWLKSSEDTFISGLKGWSEK